MSETIKDVLGKISRSSGLGDLSRAAIDNLRGINHRGYGNPVLLNKDNYGLTFFTRPNLNLSYDNIASKRVLTPLLDGEENANYTMQRAIRMLLDPYLGSADKFFSANLGKAIKLMGTPLIDQENAFMPLLTNNLISVSGWPDVSVETFTSTPGLYQESWSMVDGVARFFETFEINASFKNIEGDPISLLFFVWLHYMAGVYDGTMVPYPDNLSERRIDYQTRIYRLVLDSNRRYVQKIGATGASFPLNVPMGNAFNFTNEGVFNMDNDQLSIRFKCMGAEYQDPILIDEFNATVQVFNNKMRGTDDDRNKSYVKVTAEELQFYNYHGYPRIHPTTQELEWWIPKEKSAEYANRNTFNLANLTANGAHDPLRMT